MNPAKITWIPHRDGGRATTPQGGKYFAVAQFDDDKNWDCISWSVKFELLPPILEDDISISYGKVDFLFDTAPKSRLISGNSFYVYEGPKKVAKIELL